jgi:hypothetical protein
MQTYKAQIVRKIFDGRDFKSSKIMASTMIEIELPFAPFQGLNIAIIYPEEIKSVLWKPTEKQFACFLEDCYFASTVMNSMTLEERIEEDISNGYKLLFKQDLPN